MSHDPAEPATYWEDRYAASTRIWSGNPNATLVDVVAGLTPGRSLDLGCGEGADVIWLAQRGWQATGVDLSPSAIAHARAAAESLGLSDRAIFESGNLEDRVDAAAYDLVTACFLQSPVALAREEVLRHALHLVAPGGRLLIVSHAAAPPWSGLAHRHHGEMPQPADDLAALALGRAEWEAEWDVELAEIRTRAAVGPSGEHADLDDGVVLVRRR